MCCIQTSNRYLTTYICKDLFCSIVVCIFFIIIYLFFALVYYLWHLINAHAAALVSYPRQLYDDTVWELMSHNSRGWKAIFGWPSLILLVSLCLLSWRLYKWTWLREDSFTVWNLSKLNAWALTFGECHPFELWSRYWGAGLSSST